MQREGTVRCAVGPRDWRKLWLRRKVVVLGYVYDVDQEASILFVRWTEGAK
jgi:hypothetical protein